MATRRSRLQHIVRHLAEGRPDYRRSYCSRNFHVDRFKPSITGICRQCAAAVQLAAIHLRRTLPPRRQRVQHIVRHRVGGRPNYRRSYCSKNIHIDRFRPSPEGVCYDCAAEVHLVASRPRRERRPSRQRVQHIARFPLARRPGYHRSLCSKELQADRFKPSPEGVCYRCADMLRFEREFAAMEAAHRQPANVTCDHSQTAWRRFTDKEGTRYIEYCQSCGRAV